MKKSLEKKRIDKFTYFVGTGTNSPTNCVGQGSAVVDG